MRYGGSMSNVKPNRITNLEEQPPRSQGVVRARVVKRKRATRARLLEAAYEVISLSGVDDAKIKDVTDKADIGFGTFYNYFETKDELAAAVLDCVIDDYGRRNVEATRGLRRKNPALVMPVSMKLVMCEATRLPMWQWWAKRPDLLVDRMRKGFGRFGKRDIRDGIGHGFFTLHPDEVDASWELAVWMMAGGIHDIVVGEGTLTSEALVVNRIMRMLGVDAGRADEVSACPLPTYSKPKIDWNFELSVSDEE
jgi:AcrR family transcriptional regulator